MQPLLITIVGVAVSAFLYEAVVTSTNGASDGPCTYGPDACGYVFIGRMGQAIALIPVLLVGLLITGLVVGLSSDDSGLARRATLAGVMVPLLAGSAALVVPGAIADGHDVPFRIVSILAGAAFLGLALLIPVVLGYGVGRVIRPSPKDRSDA
jgi:hypothetical protein